MKRLNFDEETKQFVALYTNIEGEEIEKRFPQQQADKTFQAIVKFWRDIDELTQRERITRKAEYLAETNKRSGQ